MQEIITALNRLSAESKEVKATLETLLKLSRLRLLKEEWVDGQDLCSALHIGPRTLQTLRESGKLSYSKLNTRKYFYRYADIRALLKSNYFKISKKKKRHESK